MNKHTAPREFVTIQHARQRIGRSAERLADDQIQDVINLLRRFCNKTIDTVVEKKNSN